MSTRVDARRPRLWRWALPMLAVALIATVSTQSPGATRPAPDAVSPFAPLIAAGVPTDAVPTETPPGDALVPTVDQLLGRAVSANQDLIYAGSLTVVAFSERGPQISEVDLHRDGAGVRMVRDGDEFGRADGIAFGPTSSDELLQIGGVERVRGQIDRMLTKYDASVQDVQTLDTGDAVPVQLTEQASGAVREVLFLDDETGLIVRRETFGRDGAPLRVVAYTSLEVAPKALQTPVKIPVDDREVAEHALETENAENARAAGFVVPETLPYGYELVALFEMPDTSVPTQHLMYSDGLYTVSVFQQLGQPKRDVVDGAVKLTTADDGLVWRWPGTEPRRFLFSGDDITFTVLTDAPTDELIDVVSELPIDPEPSTLDRLALGLQRIKGWFGGSDDRSAT